MPVNSGTAKLLLILFELPLSPRGGLCDRDWGLSLDLSIDHRTPSTQRPLEGDERDEDECDDSGEGKGTVNVRHDAEYLPIT
jgi:hypothetical protein